VLKAAIDETKTSLEEAKAATDAVGLASVAAAASASNGFSKVIDQTGAYAGAANQSGVSAGQQFSAAAKSAEEFAAAAGHVQEGLAAAREKALGLAGTLGQAKSHVDQLGAATKGLGAAGKGSGAALDPLRLAIQDTKAGVRDLVDAWGAAVGRIAGQAGGARAALEAITGSAKKAETPTATPVAPPKPEKLTAPGTAAPAEATVQPIPVSELPKLEQVKPPPGAPVHVRQVLPDKRPEHVEVKAPDLPPPQVTVRPAPTPAPTVPAIEPAAPPAAKIQAPPSGAIIVKPDEIDVSKLIVVGGKLTMPEEEAKRLGIGQAAPVDRPSPTAPVKPLPTTITLPPPSGKTEPPAAAPSAPVAAGIGGAAAGAAGAAVTGFRALTAALDVVKAKKDALIPNFALLGQAAASAASKAASGFAAAAGGLGPLKAMLPQILEKLGQINLAVQVLAARTAAVKPPNVKPPDSDALKNIQAALTGIQNGSAAVGKAAASAWGMAIAPMLGWIRAGLGASAMGQALGMQFEMLSRTIAGMFAPEIQAIIQGVAHLTQWIRSLTNEQKESIVHWVKVAAAGLTAAIVLDKIVQKAALVAKGFVSMFAAVGLVGGIAAILAGVVVAFAALGAGVEYGKKGFAGLIEFGAEMATAVVTAFGKIQAAMQPFLGVAHFVFKSVKFLIMEVIELVGNIGAVMAPVFAGLAATVGAALFVIGAALAAVNFALDSTIGKWAVLTAALAVGANLMITSVVPAMVSMVAAIGRLIVATVAYIVKQIVSLALMGPVGWAILAASGAIAAAGVAIFRASDRPERPTSRPGRPGVGGPRDTLAPRLGGFEQIQELYFRIQTAGMQATAFMQTPEQQQLEEVRGIRLQIQQLLQRLNRLQPGVVA
jgi:hypothetical protein